MLRIGWVVAGVLALAQSAVCAPITVILQGSLTSVGPSLRSEFATGRAFTLRYSYEANSADADPSASVGRYMDSISSAEVVIGTHTYTASSGTIHIADNQFGAWDQYAVSIPTTPTALGGTVGGLTPYFAGIELRDTDQSVLVSDVLVGLPPISEFEGRAFELAFATQFTPDVAFGVERLSGIVASASVAAVPAPPVLPLLVIGVSVLLAARRFRR